MNTITLIQASHRRPGLLKKAFSALGSGFALGLMLLLLVGCTVSGKSVEMPANDGSGSDLMRKSPCACSEIDFNSRGFVWAS